jgi:hypothetical protein
MVSTVVAGIFALYLSLPASFAIHRSARQVGSAIEIRFDGYSEVEPESLRRASILSTLIPHTWDPLVPAMSFGGSPLQWNFYAHQGDLEQRKINYVLAAADAEPPPEMQLHYQTDDAALYVRSHEVLEMHRAIRPPTPAGAPIYSIPRGVLFPGLPLENTPEPVKVAEVLRWLGVDVDALRERFGLVR